MYYFLIFFSGLFFLGYKLGWSIFQYDELRLLQLLITSIIFTIIILKFKLKEYMFFLIVFCNYIFSAI